MIRARYMIYWYMNSIKKAENRTSSNIECQSHSKKASVFDCRCTKNNTVCCNG